eukprot:MONOS_11856.1-p1 / transcript=MONOS_11856.1 / gene=MONOS_11856 / organism=Monocercomonoides_exilis_PA203 / gene_product=unspecified product / transcript_product=unspecified product / location=Mono_scaffold00618:35006-37195(+) / protein_length=730 / sequence_SO=supercontig / SO=protein_coding / is_pseudo=false
MAHMIFSDCCTIGDLPLLGNEYNVNVSIDNCQFSNISSKVPFYYMDLKHDLSKCVIQHSSFCNCEDTLRSSIVCFEGYKEFKSVNCSYEYIRTKDSFWKRNKSKMKNQTYVSSQNIRESAEFSNCMFLRCTARNGGAIRIMSRDSYLTIISCKFDECSADELCGVICAVSSSGTYTPFWVKIEDTSMCNCSAQSWGGIGIAGTLLLQKVKAENISAYDTGFVLYDPVVQDVTWTEVTASKCSSNGTSRYEGDGGCFYIEQIDHSIFLKNSSFSFNYAANRGGAFLFAYSANASVQFTFCRFVSNAADGKLNYGSSKANGKAMEIFDAMADRKRGELGKMSMEAEQSRNIVLSAASESGNDIFCTQQVASLLSASSFENCSSNSSSPLVFVEARGAFDSWITDSNSSKNGSKTNDPYKSFDFFLQFLSIIISVCMVMGVAVFCCYACKKFSKRKRANEDDEEDGAQRERNGRRTQRNRGRRVNYSEEMTSANEHVNIPSMAVLPPYSVATQMDGEVAIPAELPAAEQNENASQTEIPAILLSPPSSTASASASVSSLSPNHTDHTSFQSQYPSTTPSPSAMSSSQAQHPPSSLPSNVPASYPAVASDSENALYEVVNNALPSPSLCVTSTFPLFPCPQNASSSSSSSSSSSDGLSSYGASSSHSLSEAGHSASASASTSMYEMPLASQYSSSAVAVRSDSSEEYSPNAASASDGLNIYSGIKNSPEEIIM